MNALFETRAGRVLGISATVLVAIVLAILWLDVLSPPRDLAALNATAVPTRFIAPTATPTTFPPTPPALLSDDFTKRTNWPVGTTRTPFGYVEGAYRLQPPLQPDFTSVLLRGFQDKSYRDLSLQVTALAAPGSGDAEYGLVFWHSQDARGRERFLYFGVSTQGSVRLRGYVPITPTTAVAPITRTVTVSTTVPFTTTGTATAPTSPNYRWAELEPATRSPAVNTGSQPNRLRVDVHPGRLLAYVNDSLVLDSRDELLDIYRNRPDFDGRVGLIALSPGKSSPRVLFSDFKLFVDKAGP